MYLFCMCPCRSVICRSVICYTYVYATKAGSWSWPLQPSPIGCCYFISLFVSLPPSLSLFLYLSPYLSICRAVTQELVQIYASQARARKDTGLGLANIEKIQVGQCEDGCGASEVRFREVIALGA